MTDKHDSVVIGAGAVGLAVARAMAASGREVLVLEAEPRAGMHSSSRNSEVIHAGIYYARNSLKAKLCVRGKEMLYAYCEQRRVPHKRIGKMIVASSDDDLAGLAEVRNRAEENGVADLRELTRAEVLQKEPEVVAVGGLFSPSTGIIDSNAYMLALRADIENSGGVIVFNSHVSNVRAADPGFAFDVDDDTYECRTLINSAGLGAVELMNRCLPSSVRQFFAKGHYFSYAGKSPFQHLVYPLPVNGGLGIHATLDMSGALRFGPDVNWEDSVNYNFEPDRKASFVAAIRKYFPAIDEARLVPAYTGVRPKLSSPGEVASDFLIQGEKDHGMRGLVNLFGIESPGLTSSLAIGEYVKILLD